MLLVFTTRGYKLLRTCLSAWICRPPEVARSNFSPAQCRTCEKPRYFFHGFQNLSFQKLGVGSDPMPRLTREHTTDEP